MPVSPTVGGHNALVTLQAPDGTLLIGQCDASGNLLTAGGGAGGTVTQGTAAAVAGAWPVKVTDGTNVQPTGDTQGRAIQVTPGDGTNPIFAAAAVAADAKANPTAGLLQSLLVAFNGATWDRVRSGLVGVQTTFVGLLNTITLARYNATPPTLADGNMAPLQANTVGALKTVSTDIVTTVLDLTTTTSSSASTTTVSATVTGVSNAMAISVEATLQGNTGGVLDIYLQHSPDGGTTWYDWAHWSQLLAAAAATTQIWVPGITNGNTVIGKGTAGSPGVALAANTFVGGHPFDAVRMVMVTGSGTTLGKSQIMKLHVTAPKA